MIDVRVLFFVIFFPVIFGIGVLYFKQGKSRDYGLGLHGTGMSIIVSVTPRVATIGLDLFLTHAIILIVASTCMLFTAGSYNRMNDAAERVCLGLGFFFIIFGAAWAAIVLNR